MAGNRRKQGQEKVERIVPGVEAGKASRVSKAAGSIGSSQTRVEQRATSPGSRQPVNRSASPRRSPGEKPANRKGAAAASPARKKDAFVGTPADSRLINQVRDKWSDMQPHEQQRFFSIVLLLLALFLFFALTFWRNLPLFKPLADFFFNVFSWSAWPLALGLIAFAFAHLVEGMRNIRFIRWSLVLGLLGLLVLLLAESQLLLGKTAGGIIGGLLATPLLGWGFGAHVLVLGLFVMVALLTFKVTLSQIETTFRLLHSVFLAPRQNAADEARVSPFLGKRPRFSRYGNGLADKSEAGTPLRKKVLADEEEENDEFDESEHAAVEFSDDFDAGEEDARNDINQHIHEIGRVRKGPRAPQEANRAEHLEAVKGARQQALPLQENRPMLEEMEPLAPNPRRIQFPQVNRRAARAETSSPWKLPEIALLNSPEDSKLQMLGDDSTTLAKTIQDTLRSFRVEAEVRPEDISIGPTVIRFGIRPTGKPMIKEDEKGRPMPVRDAAGNIVYEARTRVSRIMALQNDLALVLESKTIRMEAPVPGRPYVGVEIPNKNSRLVTLREILESKEYQAAKNKSKLTVALGKDVAGAVRVGDLAKMPHLLIAGATGAGKSVSINAIISSIITQATPEDVRMLMVDPKMVELSMYNGIPHLLAPVVTDVERVVGLLKIAIAEMEKRYRLFSQLGVRNLDGYRKLRAEKVAKSDDTLKNLPAIVIIIDELADLMMAAPEEVEGLICRLAQLARATGIHLVVATQRPSVDVITGLIKA
ncbi:MAG TPA: DNA translocase FtsK, partial [Ktedonobacteraceae bacterium]|nr:DNA translocase FtsK [Ktedonobacteraceae bacterium]